jgi:Transposase domain (DUF772)
LKASSPYEARFATGSLDKVPVLQALYRLSDDAIEFQISDRLSFMRFHRPGLGERAACK